MFHRINLTVAIILVILNGVQIRYMAVHSNENLNSETKSYNVPKLSVLLDCAVCFQNQNMKHLLKRCTKPTKPTSISRTQNWLALNSQSITMLVM